jgi:exodeoxyribonuclease V alpha subunit
MSQSSYTATTSSSALLATDYGELEPYVRARVIESVDIEAVKFLIEMAGDQYSTRLGTYAWVGLCLGLRAVRDGHTCVDLERIGAWLSEEEHPDELNRQWSEDPEIWLQQLRTIPELVGVPGERKPFILEGKRLYIARTFEEEQAISAAVRDRVRNRTIHVLMGGPGTGKTTKVARDLAALAQDAIDQGAKLPRIALAAPTGKAAARMSEAINNALRQLQASDEVIESLTREPARTIHQLLGYNPQADQRYRWNEHTPLPYDLVIIDETSMVSSSLMYRLLVATAPTTSLRLVGDPDQLASVDAGSVLGDLARALEVLPGASSCREVLQKVYRTESQAIIELAGSIKRADVAGVLDVLSSEGSQSIRWVEPTDARGLERVFEESVSHARRLRDEAQSSPVAALAERLKYQVLCAHREGRLGVTGWNAMTERRLGIAPQEVWYLGRPVMATRNNRSLRLANGDTGVVADQDGSKAAFFGVPLAPVRIPVARLEDVVTVHALTIHKSQGSEYDHVVVVLPERSSRIVTRELLYTAVTRAKRAVTIVGTKEVIEKAVTTPIRRATGLAAKLGGKS